MGIQCKTFDQSDKVLKDIKRRIEEFNKITKGELFEERNKAWLATAVIDSKTLDRMDARPDMEIEKRTFATVMKSMMKRTLSTTVYKDSVKQRGIRWMSGLWAPSLSAMKRDSWW